jgi:hypothetical protein
MCSGGALYAKLTSELWQHRELLMWARVIEVMLGCWLAISPFIFGHPPGARTLWTNDLTCGFVIAILALLSFWFPLRYMHIAIVVPAIWLIIVGFLSGYPAPPASQNHILLGLLLLMFAIIPNEANLPPRPWRAIAGNSSDRIQR